MSDPCKTCGCASNGGHDQAPPEALLNPNAEGNAQTTLRVAGMDCADEVEALERALKPLPGVRQVRVNLMGGKVVVAHDRSVTTEHLIQANIAFALGVKAIFLALALTGHTSLWLAILADTGATLVVIANALRLLRR